ncbi:acyl-CoA hydrolase [Absidia repens]|uniref:Acyl-CoA hydrolase n=1 Tax=Absidia repens TaxID=90262 RepID=A0A1X2I800_9FUNG|nr:acyl-CoA hydrolase [Absidia repens]
MDKIIHKENQKDPKVHHTKERVLVDKTMADSHMDVYLPFKSSPELLEEYIFVDGRIRTGKLLEDLDALAGAIAYKHIDNNDPQAAPVTIVTASVDRLDLFLPKAVENYRLSGNVTYVGTSSMEIFIKGEIVPENADIENGKEIDVAKNSYLDANTVLATRFTMVAIDSSTHKPVQINPLITTSPAEKRIREVAKMNKKRKKKEAEASLTRQAPTAQESLEMHDMFLEFSQYVYNNSKRDGDYGDDFASTLSPDERKPLPDDCVWMSDTRRDTLILCHAQFRNVHNNIFGGFIMKKALELSFATASTFLRSKAPIVLSMDGVTFRKPVYVGSLLSMKAGVVWAGYPHRSLQVRVVASVIDIEKNSKETTNVFYFTLSCTDDDIKVPRVLPRTYAEIMLWLDGRRRRTHGLNARRLLLDDLAPLPHSLG